MILKKWITLLAVICMAVGLTGCNSSQKTKDKDVLNVGVTSLSGTFNPIYVKSVYDSYVTDLVYDSLLSRDYEGNRISNIAQDLPVISEDHKTYTFHLKDNIKFSNQDALTAEDVAFSFTVLADPVYDGPYSSIVSNLVGYEAYHNNETNQFTGIEVVDEQTIVFHFVEGYRTNIDSLASLGIMNKQSFPKYKKGNLESLKQVVSKPVGSGPYQLKSWKSDTGAMLIKNEYYDREGYEIKKINIMPINDASLLPNVESGNIDLLAEVNTPEVISAASNYNDLKFNEYANAGISWLTLNCESGATADRNVRKALSMAFDKEAFVNNYFACADCDSKISLAYTPKLFQNPISSLNEYVLGKKSVEGMEDDSYNVKASAQLLEDSGWIKGKKGIRYKDGKKLTVKVMVAQEQKTSETLVAMWKKDWEKIGVELKVTSMEFNSMISKAGNDDEIEDWNAFTLSSVFSSDDLDSIYTMLHSSSAGHGGSNLARIRSDAIDAVLEEGRSELDSSKVNDIYLRAAAIIHNEYAYLPIYGTQKFDFYNKRIEQFNTSSYYPWTKALKDAKLK